MIFPCSSINFSVLPCRLVNFYLYYITAWLPCQLLFFACAKFVQNHDSVLIVRRRMEFSLGVTFFNLPISDDHTSRTREKAVPSGEGGPQWSENAVKRNGRGERGPAKRLGMHHLLKSMIAMLFFVRCFLSPFPRVPSPRCSGRPFPRGHSLHFVSFVAGPLLAAARSRSGSDMPPACHSLPSHRFATQRGRLFCARPSRLFALFNFTE